MTNVLKSIKKLIGIYEADTSFDADLIMHINAVLMTLQQLGVVSKECLIETGNETWDDIIEEDTDYKAIKSYIGLKVRIMFDPPANSTALEAFKESAKELEWRLNIEYEEGGDI